jgi:hypothetical protein
MASAVINSACRSRWMTCDATEPAAHLGLDLGIEVREGADRTRQLPHRHHVARPQDTIEIALQLRVPQRQLDAERHRLGMHAVGAADHRRPAMLLGARAHRLHQAGDPLDDEAARLAHLQRLRGVDDVGGGQAEVEPARRRPDLLGHRGRERNHIVLRRPLDLFDAGDVERRSRPQLAGRVGGHEPGVGHGVGCRQFNLEPRFVAYQPKSNRAAGRFGAFGPSTVTASEPFDKRSFATRWMSSEVTRCTPARVSSRLKWRSK